MDDDTKKVFTTFKEAKAYALNALENFNHLNIRIMKKRNMQQWIVDSYPPNSIYRKLISDEEP